MMSKYNKISLKQLLKIVCAIAFLIPFFCFSQNVGIKTQSPSQTLDINGSLRIRSINTAGTSTVKDSVMVFENDGVVKYASSSQIIQQIPQGFFPMVTNSKLTGTGTSSNPLGIPSLSASINQALGWDNTSGWIPVHQISSSNWLSVGNSNTLSTNFLGATNDISFNIRSNNTTMLQFGRRQTLGLFDSSNTGLYPYNQPNDAVAYIRGTNGNSSLQFESSMSQIYKPVFFTDSSGNFGFRGSAAGNDWFEATSSGSNNDGSLRFTIGDDGNEPIVFRKYNNSTNSYVEMMRMKGLGLDNRVTVGINVNGNQPNSTFEVKGSVSRSISTITASTTLTEAQYTLLLNNSNTITVTLPSASGSRGRIYVLKKLTSSTVNISSYLNRLSSSSTVLPNGVTQLQSDGTNWQQIN